MDEIVDNLREPSSWIRILFMLAFATVLYIVIAPLLLVLMLAQALFSVITGSSNQNLGYLGSALIQYVAQILAFITYNSEEKPFPFSDFPSPAEPESDNKPSAPSAAKPKKKTAARKKSPAKKKPADQTPGSE
ncbi:MAG: DUF4389 domain-containing protein [Gammaproteobacteria bacterium]